MPSLKELRIRKKSVQATKKITSAMKLIAGAKLRRAQEKAQAARPYAALMSQMLVKLVGGKAPQTGVSNLLTGSGQNKVSLIIVATSNRGLCGGFNSSIVRHVRRLILMRKSQGQDVKLICIGRKGYEQLKREYRNIIIEIFEAFDKPSFYEARRIADLVLDLFNQQGFDSCSIVYNKFISALSQKVTEHRLIPYTALETLTPQDQAVAFESSTTKPYDFEPSEQQVLDELLPKNLAVQIFGALLENMASEQGARMAAMESATRNAEDMIRALDLKYNRTRQAFITKELIEIISGAEAL
ncbi:MAG: F0F1 ATP synthase subunit gamma [Janthinobacterium lividum]